MENNAIVKNVIGGLMEKDLIIKWKGDYMITLNGFCSNYGYSKDRFYSDFIKYKVKKGWRSMTLLGLLFINLEDFVELYHIRMDNNRKGLKPLWLLVREV